MNIPFISGAPKPSASAAAFALAAAATLAACGAGGGTKVAVTGTNDACTPQSTTLAAGKTTFVFTNKASETSELYVLRTDNSIVGEVENVTPGIKRNLSVSLPAGEYFLVCKPGQKGDGIRTEIEVTGEGGAEALVAQRTVTVKASTFAFAFDEPLSIRKGEIIRFEMTNLATEMDHEMEIFGPDGEAIAEIGPTKPGATGTVTMQFAEAGTYRFVCGIEGHEGNGMVAVALVAEI